MLDGAPASSPLRLHRNRAGDSCSDRVFRQGRAEALMTPTIKYRPEDNAAYIRLSQQKVLDSAEVAPDVVFDYDAEGRIVGIELLDARAQLSPELLIEAA
jgi:uncharacterized protein YuzE